MITNDMPKAAKILSEKFNINNIIAEILVSRGIDTENKASVFLNSNIESLYDPFLLNGMTKAVEKIKKYIAENKSIVIYGDYDTDGICSVSILYLYFLSKNANVNWYIPEREEGYGINKEAIDYIVKEYKPDLIISVDCGVTAIDETQYIKSFGIDVIITDHHNSSGNLPETIVINPKISSDYSFKELCGAGVALKVIQAIDGIAEAKKYIDIAAIATVADSVELKSENRIIVNEGLKSLNTNCRKGIKILCDLAGLKDDFNTFTIAFGISPRINAAGRIGEAKRAVALFYEQDEKVLKNLCLELNEENTKRQKICEDIICDLTNQIKSENMLNMHSLIVIDKSGYDGVSGIVASKLCEKYFRPTFVFCEFNGCLKGSGRSIEGIDIYDMLLSMEDLFVKFGGHSYAVGVTIKKENVEEFRKRADKYIEKRADFLNFIKQNHYDYDLSEKNISSDFISALNIFEPCGVGNLKPRFLIKAGNLKTKPLKKFPNHLSFKLLNTDFMAFNFGDKADILNSNSNNSLFIEFSQNKYKGKIYDKGYLKDIEIDAETAFVDKIKSNYLMQLSCKSNSLPDFELYDYENINNLIEEKLKIFGTLIIVFDKKSLNDLYLKCPLLKKLKLSIFFKDDGNNLSKVLLSPDINFCADGYENIIFADIPLYSGYIKRLSGNSKNVYIPKNINNKIHNIKYDLSREIFKEYYKMITDTEVIKLPFENITNFYYNITKKYNNNISLVQFVVCFIIFNDLGFIKLNKESGLIEINNKIKKELNYSCIYQKLNYYKKTTSTLQG